MALICASRPASATRQAGPDGAPPATRATAAAAAPVAVSWPASCWSRAARRRWPSRPDHVASRAREPDRRLAGDRQGRAAARRRHDRERQRRHRSARHSRSRSTSAASRSGRQGRIAGRRDGLTIQVVVKRPGWISWLAGKTADAASDDDDARAPRCAPLPDASRTAPAASLQFKQPIATFSYGLGRRTSSATCWPARRRRHAAAHRARPARSGSRPRRARGRPRKAQLVSWFPHGSGASAVANPRPGTTIKPTRRSR